MLLTNQEITFLGKKSNVKKLPHAVKRIKKRNGEKLVLTQEIDKDRNGYSEETLSLYKERKIARGLKSYILLETKGINGYKNEVPVITKDVFDESGKQIIEYTAYKDGRISACTPEIDIRINNDQHHELEIEKFNVKSNIKSKSLRPEIKRIFKLITQSFESGLI